MPTLFRAELRGGQAVGQPRLLRVGVRLGLCLVIGLFVACHREEDQSSTDSTAVNRAAYGSRGSPGTNSADARAIAQFKIRHYQLKLSASDLAALQSDSFSND